MGRGMTWLIGFVAAILGVFSLAAPGLCPVALILAIVFLLMGSRQSRIDQRAREERQLEELARRMREEPGKR